MSESVANNYCCAVISLCQINEIAKSLATEGDSNSEINNQSRASNVETKYEEKIRQSSCVYYTWFGRLQSLFKMWNEKLCNNELVIDDVLTLLKYRKYTLAAAASRIEIDRTVIDIKYEKFKESFHVLCDLLLPKVPLRNSSER